MAVVLLGAGVGEPEPPVGAEREIVRACQVVAGDAGRQQLDSSVVTDTLDAGDGAEVTAPRDVAALGDVNGAIRAEQRPPWRSASVGERAHRAVLPAQELADVAVA